MNKIVPATKLPKPTDHFTKIATRVLRSVNKKQNKNYQRQNTDKKKIMPYVVPGMRKINREENGLLWNLIKATCKVTKVDIDKLYTNSRFREIIDAKHIIRYIARKHYNFLYPEISLIFVPARANHATCISSFNRTTDLLMTDEEFCKKFYTIAGELNIVVKEKTMMNTPKQPIKINNEPIKDNSALSTRGKTSNSSLA